MIERKGEYGKPFLNNKNKERSLRKGSMEERKRKLKTAIIELFENGSTPGTISDETLAEILEIEKPNASSEDYKKKLARLVTSNIQTMYNGTTKKQWLEMQYGFYLEDKKKKVNKLAEAVRFSSPMARPRQRRWELK